ncbi:Disease resistance protein RPV1 [Linum grandiflorum]
MGYHHHDVFVSFRGRDVRYKFVDHLFAALRRNKVTTFRDDRSLRRGESIEDGVRRAIEKSSFYVVVLTPNYTSSPWCLDELVKMMKWCSSSSKGRSKMIFPIFYHVLPEDVSRYYYHEVDDVDQKCTSYTKERAGTWLRALHWIAGVAGWVVSDGRYVFICNLHACMLSFVFCSLKVLA